MPRRPESVSNIARGVIHAGANVRSGCTTEIRNAHHCCCSTSTGAASKNVDWLLKADTRRSPEPQGHHRKVGKLSFNFAESRLSFLTPESRERSFSRENHLFKLAVGTAAIAALREGRPVSRFVRLAPRIRENSLRGLSEFLYLYKFQVKPPQARLQATFRRIL